MMAALFIFVTIVNFAAMGYMHNELHDIQELGKFQPSRVGPAIDALNDTHHSLRFSGIPLLAFLGALVILGLGLAIAWSVITPVRRMGQAMGRIASGDFSEPLQINNNDELGELASRINQTAEELARLQEATLSDERARALRERIAQVTLAQEEERRRISRELHDGLGPSLAAIGNRLRACRYMVLTDPQRAERELDEMAASLKGHVQEVRELIYDLRPLTLDQLGLVGAVSQYVERFGHESGIQASFTMSGGVALNPLAEVTVLRVVQECLTNVQKHSDASQVEVTLQVVDGTGLEAKVKDNGRGFNSHGAASGAVGTGMGLLSMHERAELLGGSLSVQSRPEKGCEITLFIPPQEVEAGAHSNPSGR